MLFPDKNDISMEAFRRKQITSDYKFSDGDSQGQSYLTHANAGGHEDIRNNNHITLNPFDEHKFNFAPLSVIVDECDLLNNNMTLANGNILSVSLTSPSSTTVTTSIQSSQHCLKFCHKTSTNSNHRQPLIEKLLEQTVQIQTEKSPKKINNNIAQKYDAKLANNKKGKKKKEKPKPKPLRGGPSGGAVGGAGGRGRGMSEQEQMMKRPRRKTKKEEK